MNANKIAQSGLAASQTRLAVSAHNTANQSTEGAAAQRITQQARPSGGVQTHIDTISISETSQGIDGVRNNIDPVQETVTRISSASDFHQNARVIRTQDEMQKNLLDITA